MNLPSLKLILPAIPYKLPDMPVVLHVRAVAGMGEAQDKNILRSATYGPPAGLQVAAAYIHPSDDLGIETLHQRARAVGCPFYAIPDTRPAKLETTRDLLQVCRRLHVAVWHGHDYKSNVLGLLLRGFWPMKLVTTVRGWSDQTAAMWVRQSIDRLCISRYDHVLAISRSAQDACRSVGVADDRLTYLPDGIDLRDYPRLPEPGARDIRAEMGVDPRRFVIGTIGPLSPPTSIDRAVKLMGALLPRFPQAELHIVGDGPERQRLEQLAAGLGVQSSVRFWGGQAHGKRFYEMMDLLLLPSRTRGLTSTALEAMAMDVCVAATKAGDIPDLLDKGRCGLLLSRDSRKWPDLLAPLLVNGARRREVAQRARLRAEDHYSLEHRAAAEIEIYQRVLSIKGGVRQRAA